MKEYIGKVCKVHINVIGKKKGIRQNLFYRATIKYVSNSHITFIDKWKKQYTYRLSDVIEVQPIG